MPWQTEIGITPWVTSHNDDIMPQPEQFRPERWLDATKDERILMGIYAPVHVRTQLTSNPHRAIGSLLRGRTVVLPRQR